MIRRSAILSLSLACVSYCMCESFSAERSEEEIEALESEVETLTNIEKVWLEKMVGYEERTHDVIDGLPVFRYLHSRLVIEKDKDIRPGPKRRAESIIKDAETEPNSSLDMATLRKLFHRSKAGETDELNLGLAMEFLDSVFGDAGVLIPSTGIVSDTEIQEFDRSAQDLIIESYVSASTKDGFEENVARVIIETEYGALFQRNQQPPAEPGV